MTKHLEAVRLLDISFGDTGAQDDDLDQPMNRFHTLRFGIVIDSPRETVLRCGSLLQDGTELEAGLPDGYRMTFQEVDVRRRTELPWVAGRVVSKVRLMVLRSNRLETKPIVESGAISDSEREKLLAEEQMNKYPPPPFPASNGPADGAQQQAPKAMVLEEQGRLELRATWRLPMLPEELVQPAHAESNKANGLMQKEGDTCAAGVELHLVLLRGKEEVPKQYPPQMPVSRGKLAVNMFQTQYFPVGMETLSIGADGKEWASEPATTGDVAPGRKEYGLA